MKKSLFLVGILCLAALLFSCGTTQVSRVSDDEEIDLSGYWNDSDIRRVCEDLVDQCTSSPRVARFKGKSGKTPTVIIDRIRNLSEEHIDTRMIANKIETAIINDGTMNFVASGSQREAIRKERMDQADNASYNTQSAMGNEVGADLMMQGSVESILDTEANKEVRKYTVTLKLVDMGTNVTLWQGQSDVKKFVKRAKYKA